MAAVALLGTTVWNTTAGNKTITATPTLGDLIFIFAPCTLAGGTISVTDNNTDGRGTYTQVHSDFTGFSTNGVLTGWIRNALIGSATSTIFTATQTSSTGGGLVIFRVTGMSIVGLGAVRGAGGQSAGTLGTTPAPVLLGRVGAVFSGTQAALTGNAVVGSVCNGTSPAGLTPPASFTESPTPDLGYTVPTTGFESVRRDSGETGSTITWGSTSATAFASLVVELDASVPQYDYVTFGRADKDRLIVPLSPSITRAGSW
jgi:hypothetical protein